MTARRFRVLFVFSALVLCLLAGVATAALRAQSPDSASAKGQQSSSSGPMYQREKAPSLVDPAGPTISLVSSEPVFVMAAAMNACGYDEGLEESAPVRMKVREEMNQALAKSEDARNKRDKVCLYIAQHRMTGTVKDVSQYISLALYLTPPPELETSVDLPEMPPDSTQVVEILPLLRDFAAAVDLHGIWLAVRRTYDAEIDKLHDPLSKMIVSTNLYLKMPASTYDGRRFVVVIEPLLSPHTINARVYGTDYVVVVSPVDGQIRMSDVRHTYLHYIIEPLLYSRANAIDRMQPILKEVREAPLEFIYRSDTVPLTIECLIKAIEARTMDTGIPVYKIPAGVQRSDLPRYEHERQVYQQKVEAIRIAAVKHDMNQGFVLTQYFWEQLIQFEKDPASLRDTIGEMVYTMDVDQQVHRARELDFDKEGDGDVLRAAGRGSSPAWIWPKPVWRLAMWLRLAPWRGRRSRCTPIRLSRWPIQLARTSSWPGPRFSPAVPAMRSTDSKRRWLPAKTRAWCPGRTSTWAVCSTWTASAMRPYQSTSWPWRPVTGSRIRASPPSAA